MSKLSNFSKEQIMWVKYLKVFCMLQVFILHYCASHDFKDLVWLFRGAVPTFILISAYLYGLKNVEQRSVFGFSFLKRRFMTLSVPYYFFLFCVFLFFSVSNPAQISHYTVSLVSELLYLTDFGSVIEPLPYCGHLYFLQLLIMCYILLFILSDFNILKKGESLFRNKWPILFLFLLLLSSGIVFRRLYFIVFFFYLLVYYNANFIMEASYRINTFVLIVLIATAYLVYLFIKTMGEGYFSFLFQLWGYIVGILVIMFFSKMLKNVSGNHILFFFSSFLMEFYLIHHLFVFDYPIYLSFTLTILLSILLNRVSKCVLTRMSF